MRIFTAVRHANDPAQYYGGLWSGNFYPALRALGHEIVESQVDLLPLTRILGVAGGFTREEHEARARTTQAILDEVTAAHRQEPILLFLCYFYNSHFDPDGFEQLRRLGIVSVNFYCNSINQFETVKAIAAKVNFSWHTEKEARADYLEAGARPVWVQMGADPGLYRPVAGVERLPRLAFIGQRYADRDRWLAALLKAGQPLDIYGDGWQPLSDGGRAPGAAALSSYLGRKSPAPGSLPSYVEVALAMLRRYGARFAARPGLPGNGATGATAGA